MIFIFCGGVTSDRTSTDQISRPSTSWLWGTAASAFFFILYAPSTGREQSLAGRSTAPRSRHVLALKVAVER